MASSNLKVNVILTNTYHRLHHNMCNKGVDTGAKRWVPPGEEHPYQCELCVPCHAAGVPL